MNRRKEHSRTVSSFHRPGGSIGAGVEADLFNGDGLEAKFPGGGGRLQSEDEMIVPTKTNRLMGRGVDQIMGQAIADPVN